MRQILSSLHFMEEITEPWRGYVIFLRSHSPLMAELGFKAKQPDGEPLHRKMSLLNHESPLVSILGKWKTQFHEKKNPRYRHHHHHSRQGAVPGCAGQCTECWEDKETSSPAACLNQPDLWPPGPQCLTALKQCVLTSPRPQIMDCLGLLFYFLPLLCHLFITFYLVLWLFIYIVTQLSLCTLLSPLPGWLLHIL